jgi:hypothetical protein
MTPRCELSLHSVSESNLPTFGGTGERNRLQKVNLLHIRQLIHSPTARGVGGFASYLPWRGMIY